MRAVGSWHAALQRYLAREAEMSMTFFNSELTAMSAEYFRVCTQIRLFYGCSYMHHLSGNNRRDSHFMGS